MSREERKSLLSSGAFSFKKDYPDLETDDDGRDKEVEQVPVCCSYRFGVIICCTLSMSITYAIQASLSSAMVCMLETKDHSKHSGFSSQRLFEINDNATTIDAFNLTVANGTDNHYKDWLFGWDKTQQGLAISTFFMGYYIAQIPSSIAAAVFGPKRVIVVSLILVSIFQGLAVPAAYYDIGWLYADRVIVGIIDGFLYAPTFALAGRWAPRQETSLLFGIVGIGMELGNVLSYATSLLACEIVVQEGWPFVFYIMAGVGLVIAVLFMVVVSDSPYRNRHISRKEARFIAASMPKRQPSRDEALYRIPMKDILKSPCVWAIVVSQIGSDWLYYFYVTMEPTFLEDVIKLTYAEVNLLSGLPFLGIIPTIYLSGYLCDRLVTKGVISNTNVRKINDFICKIIPSAILVGLGFLPQDSTAAAFVLNLVGAMSMGFSYVSWMANPVDLAPAYTGFIVGICEIGAIWVGIAVPILFDVITVDRTREEWQLVFYITAGIQVFCFLFYAIFASGELQPWAFSTSNREVYDNLDGPADFEKRLLDEEFRSKSLSRASVGSVKMNSSAESEAHDLLSSLSLSLGKFHGTKSYEAATKFDQDKRILQNDVRSSTLIIKGPAYTSSQLQSGQILTECEIYAYNISNGAVVNDNILGQGCPPQITIPSEAGIMAAEFAADMYIESDDESWQNKATRSLPSNLTPSVFHGRGDHDIWSAMSSGQFSGAGHPDSNRNVKSLATEIAEALSVHSLHEKTKDAEISKIHSSPARHGIHINHASLVYKRKSLKEKEKDLSKFHGLFRKQERAIMNLDNSKQSNTPRNKSEGELPQKPSMNKSRSHKADQKDPPPNSGNTSSIMVPSEELLDSVDKNVNNKHNKKEYFRGRRYDKGKESRKKISGLVKRLLEFGRSKSNPDLSSLPDEETFVFVTDKEVEEACNLGHWTTKSVDSARDLGKENRTGKHGPKSKRSFAKPKDESSESDEKVLFAYPREPRMNDK